MALDFPDIPNLVAVTFNHPPLITRTFQSNDIEDFSVRYIKTK